MLGPTAKSLEVLGEVAVFGGTGHFGRRIVGSFVERGVPVRVLTRSAQRAKALLGETPQLIEGDITHTESVDRALIGAQSAVFAVSAFAPKLVRHRLAIERDAVIAAFARAERLGVGRVVLLSGYDVQERFVERLGVEALARPMIDVQRALQSTTLNWTVIGCAPSMELYFAMLRGDRINVPGGGPPALPTVSPFDVGEVAAQAAMRHDLEARRVRVSGPEALSFQQAAQRISSVWGRDITVRRIPLLPLRVAAALSRPFTPYVRLLYQSVVLMNAFPEEVAAQVPEDHARLLETFDLQPTTIEDEARRRLQAPDEK